MKVLVTGGGGFSGRHLIRYLTDHSSAQLHCTSLNSGDGNNCLPCDLSKEAAAAGLIEQIMPDELYHLAGARTNDYETDYRANVLSARNLLESLVKKQPKCRVLLIGSSAEYGLVHEQDNPVSEDHPLAPVTNYGLTKVYQTYLMRFYAVAYGMEILMARPFNLLGAGAPNQLFVGHVYEQIRAYQAGAVSTIAVGNLECKRDYIDVAEAVRYYHMIMQRGKAGEIYNVASGVSVSIRALLRRILEQNGLSMGLVEERTLEAKTEVKDLVGDITKLKSLMRDVTSMNSK